MEEVIESLVAIIKDKTKDFTYLGSRTDVQRLVWQIKRYVA